METLLIDAKNEIIALRRRNEVMEAQLGIVEVFAAALGLRKNNGGMASPDIVYALNSEIMKMEKKSFDEMMQSKEQASKA